MNIPDDAVEAAAQALSAEVDPYGEWEKQVPSYRELFRRRVTRVIEAAAPHLMAAAWDEASSVDQVHHRRICRRGSLGFRAGRETKPQPVSFCGGRGMSPDDVPLNCDYCGRFLSKTVEHDEDGKWLRTVYTCSNTQVDHIWDEY